MKTEKAHKQGEVRDPVPHHWGWIYPREAVEACSAEYGWSESDSNFSNKLEKQTLRYREALELAEVLGYEIVWQKRRRD